jgi:hypothetical protein
MRTSVLDKPQLLGGATGANIINTGGRRNLVKQVLVPGEPKQNTKVEDKKRENIALSPKNT